MMLLLLLASQESYLNGRQPFCRILSGDTSGGVSLPFKHSSILNGTQTMEFPLAISNSH